MRDFTLTIYKELLEKLISSQYRFVTFQEYLQMGNEAEGSKLIILRHDVDKRAQNSLKTAQIENQLGIKGVYYFRIVKESNHPEIIEAIADLGHEIGYHYEDLTLAKGNIEEAKNLFANNLSYFRQYYPVTTICMHGSPMTKWDNKDIWKHINYRQYGIIGEPYFDLDFNQFQYLTDTGRRWDGDKVSIRDKVSSKYYSNIKKTGQFIAQLNNNSLSDKLMVTVHPQRWDDSIPAWFIELFSQNLKNTIKYAAFYMIKRRKG
jgi:hypothetical protein